MDRILFTVSTRVSPFLTEDEPAEKLTTSALKRFSANSKERRVRVLFSKKQIRYRNITQRGNFLYGSIQDFLKFLGSV